MIRIVTDTTLNRLRQETEDRFEGMLAVIKRVTRERDEAREQLGEARRQAAAFEREAKEYHRGLVAEERRCDALAAQVDGLTTEAGQLRAELEILLQAARAVGLTILLRHGRYHSVHPDLEAAKRCAEQHGASRYGWDSGSASGSEGTPAWSVVGYSKPQALAAPTRQAEELKERR
jgi:chromosome segregation ATPase